jgi:uncharacterized protein Yka (UPF0111/DUF47 family)
MPELNLIPRVAKYFDMFQRSADLNLEGARLLAQLLEPGADVDRISRKLKDVEHSADENTHEIFGALNVSFVTPLDREDISELASALDDVIDWTEEAGRRVRLYRLTDLPPLAQKLAHVLRDQAEQVAEGVALLGPRRKADELERKTREIHRLENEGDDLFADAIASVYDGVTDVPGVIRAIRLSDLYAVLETATDKAEHVAVVMHNIALKHG